MNDELKVQLAGGDVILVNWGLVYAVFCAPKGMPIEEVGRKAYACPGCGGGSAERWVKSYDTMEKIGHPDAHNPGQCEDDPDRLHYLLNC